MKEMEAGPLAAQFAELLPGEPQVEGVYADGPIRITANWDDGSKLKIDVHDDHVDWKDLTAKRRGLYATLAEKTPPFFKARGIDHFTMTPATSQAKRALLRRLDWQEQEDGSYRTEL